MSLRGDSSNQRRPAPQMKELLPEVPPATAEDADGLRRGFDYLASRGPDGMPEVKRWLLVAHRPAPWLRQVQVHGAVANDHIEMVKFITAHPDVLADVNVVDQGTGYRPLHHATVWGRPSMAVLLMSRGADPTLRNRADATPFDMARQRLGRLLSPKLDSYDDIDYMRQEGRELVEIFEAVEKAGSYERWAAAAIGNRHVLRHSARLVSNANRTAIAVLRELVMRGRARVMAMEEVAAVERAAAEAAAAAKAAAAGPPLTLEEAMDKAGLLKEQTMDHLGRVAKGSGRKIMLRQMNKLLGVDTLADLGGVTREDIAELDEIDPAERRALWHFVQQNQPAESFAMAADADKKKKDKVAAKPKKKKADGDLAALLAEGSGGAKKSSKAKPKAAPAKAAATAPPTPAGKRSGGAEDLSATGTLAESELGYARRWPDEPTVLRFIFRSDLPTDAFSMIAKQLYN